MKKKMLALCALAFAFAAILLVAPPPAESSTCYLYCRAVRDACIAEGGTDCRAQFYDCLSTCPFE